MSWNTLVRPGESCTSPTAGSAVGSCAATRVSLRAGSWLDSASAASAEYMSTNVCTTRGSSALPASCRTRPSSLEAHRLVIGALRHERVEVVDDGEDARAERDLVAFQAGRIPLAVPSFVMAEDEGRHRVREGHSTDDLRADLRMDANLLEFFLSERTRLRQDVFGHRELPDVMQQRGGLDALDLVFRHAERARESGGVHLH